MSGSADTSPSDRVTPTVAKRAEWGNAARPAAYAIADRVLTSDGVWEKVGRRRLPPAVLSAKGRPTAFPDAVTVWGRGEVANSPVDEAQVLVLQRLHEDRRVRHGSRAAWRTCSQA